MLFQRPQHTKVRDAENRASAQGKAEGYEIKYEDKLLSIADELGIERDDKDVNEIAREVAPYIGVSWRRDLGQTADLTEDDGGDVSQVAGVIGIRVWF